MVKALLPDYMNSKLIDELVRTNSDSASTVPIVYRRPPLTFLIARSFGFCFGVKQALEKAYLALQNNPNKPIYLLGEIIHNPLVNEDLRAKGITFIDHRQNDLEKTLQTIPANSVVIIPAFGAPLSVYETLKQSPEIITYDTTCPFVQKVWQRAEALSAAGFSIVIHAKPQHEETLATLSHCLAPTMIIQNIDDASALAAVIRRELSPALFATRFSGLLFHNFSAQYHLEKIGLINQTTMLASETQQLSAIISQAISERYGPENLPNHYAQTKDTLCYATNKNQQACLALAASSADLALVIGGYNSSNTSHLAKIIATKLPTYFIDSPNCIVSNQTIRHFSLSAKATVETSSWLLGSEATIAITAGASCPDKLIEQVIEKVCQVTSH